MANTYTQLNVHAIFSVQNRENILRSHFEDRLFSYTAGILKNLNQYALAVNGHKDHIHIFFELNPVNNLSEIIKKVKANSTNWINEMGFLPGKFNWQEGYAAFSYSRGQRDRVIQYINRQEEHHRHKSFKEEYLEFLEKFEVGYDNRYLFEFYDC